MVAKQKQEDQDVTAQYQPWTNPILLGHDKALAQVNHVFQSGNVPHAWLITGAKGIGKATLAYRVARFLLSGSFAGGLFGAPSDDLMLDPSNPTFIKVANQNHSDLLTIAPSYNEKTKKYNSAITVDESRKIGSFFQVTAAETPYRVVIVDSVDVMNTNAANAMLKWLEEPPAHCFLFLISHQPERLLPTIRSRCMQLALDEISDADVTNVLLKHYPSLAEGQLNRLALLAGGRPGFAVRLLEMDGLILYERLLEMLSQVPNVNRVAAFELVQKYFLADKASYWGDAVAIWQFIVSQLLRSYANAEDIAIVVGKEPEMFAKVRQHLSLTALLEYYTAMLQIHQQSFGGNGDMQSVTVQLIERFLIRLKAK